MKVADVMHFHAFDSCRFALFASRKTLANRRLVVLAEAGFSLAF
jgi:hypothetical protein